MPCYRLTFDNHQTYQVEIAREPSVNPADAHVGATVFRIVKDRLERVPLRHENGQPLEFFALSEGACLAIVCDVIQRMYRARLIRIIESSPVSPTALPHPALGPAV